MFFRLLKYNAILMIRSKEGLFWTVAYPLLLSWLYFAAFSSAFNFSTKKINVGIEDNNPLHSVISYVPLLNVIDIKTSDAEKELKKNRIDGFIKNDGNLIVKDEGLNQTIITSILEQIKQTNKLGLFISPLNYNKSYIKNISEKQNTPLILFYSLLAMVSLYGMFGAISIPFSMQANISKLGARISSTPLNRFMMCISGILFYTLFNIASNILYILFVMYVLKINLITNFTLTFLVLVIGNIFGVAFGIFIGSLHFGDERTKTLICVFSSLFLAFLSGMMSPDVKIALDKTFPIINKINPIGLLTDNFYNINILQEYSLIQPFIIVFVTAIVIILTAIFINSRKVQYDSL